MKNKYEIRLAWKIWKITYNFNDLLWDRYGDHFLELASKTKDRKGKGRLLGPLPRHLRTTILNHYILHFSR